MDESHRLVAMKDGYDPLLFNRIHKEVRPLINKLAYGIDHRRFGVEHQDIVSAFEIKLLYSFNKYIKTANEQYVKGFVIRSLQLYSNRLISQSYADKFATHPSDIDIVELYDETQIQIDECNHSEQECLLRKATQFLRRVLSDNEFLILQVELNPPPYIVKEMEDLGKSLNTKIPNEVIADFLGMSGKAAIDFVRECRVNIAKAIELARRVFQNNYVINPKPKPVGKLFGTAR